MAAKKDLVEAYSFSRRRLVTAFVSGAPGGREVEPTRPGRAVVGGLALAVLLVAGGAVLGILRSPQTVQWDEEQFITDKDTAADYLLLERTDGSGETELRPLVNITSAMLVFGSELAIKRVPGDQFERPTGASIGILGAPATPPAATSLIQTGWTACTGPTGPTGTAGTGIPTGIDLALSAAPAATPAPDLTFVVQDEEGGVYVIAQSRGGSDRDRAYAYPVPDDDARQRVLSAVAGTTAPVTVPARWIGLFPPGGRLALETFGIAPDRFGDPWPGRGSTPGTDGARVGDLLRTDDALYVLTDGQGVLELDGFAEALYTNLRYPGGRQPEPIEAFQAPATDVQSSRDLPDAFWPSEVRGEVLPTGRLCALLDAQGREPGVLVATAPDDNAPDPSDPSTVTLDLDDVAVSVDSGRGAVVESGDFTAGGPSSTFLVDDRGFGYPVGPGEAQERLGFGDVEEVEVPDVWVELLRPGVPLTIEAARCPPSSDAVGGCS